MQKLLFLGAPNYRRRFLDLAALLEHGFGKNALEVEDEVGREVLLKSESQSNFLAVR